jgi:2-polyprenyl-3-methyl-5-hydroxy-6-metoxy-1,4-benzoquinol methylase
MKTMGRSQEVVSGNVFDKYGSKNPVVRALMSGYFSALKGMLRDIPALTIVEVGCGEGEIGNYLRGLYPRMVYTGFDVSPEVVKEAKGRYPDLAFDVLSIYDIPSLQLSADIVIASEVFEHLDNPSAGMSSVLGMTFKYLLISVPREPIWRVLNVARGKYLADWGNTPGHLNHWSKSSFLRFLSSYSSEVEIVQVKSPFPWTMVLLRRRAGHQ